MKSLALIDGSQGFTIRHLALVVDLPTERVVAPMIGAGNVGSLTFESGRNSMLWPYKGIPTSVTVVATTTDRELIDVIEIVADGLTQYILPDNVMLGGQEFKYFNFSLFRTWRDSSRWLNISARLTNRAYESRSGYGQDSRITDLPATYQGGRTSCVCGIVHRDNPCNWTDSYRSSISSPSKARESKPKIDYSKIEW